MQATGTLTSVQQMSGPQILCDELSAFDESDVSAVQRAFKSVKPCQMHQSWRPEVSPRFTPAAVRVGWRNDCLLVFAELTDHDVFTHARRINQRLWELGDAFEIYLRPDDQTAYLQVDIAPNKLRVHLRVPSAEAMRRAQTANEFADLVLPECGVHSTTWLEPDDEKWFVYAALPDYAVCGRANLNAEARWHFSFSRYDYTRGQFEPVISLTSPHAQANFHRQQEWGVIQFSRGQTQQPVTERLAASNISR